MERSKIVETCREVIYECVPDMEGTPLYEDTVINTDTAIDSMGFTMIICRLEARFDVKIPMIICRLEARFDVKIPQRQWSKMSTFGDVVNAFDKRINRRF